MYIQLTEKEFSDALELGFKPFLSKLVASNYTYKLIGSNEEELYEIEISTDQQAETGKES